MNTPLIRGRTDRFAHYTSKAKNSRAVAVYPAKNHRLFSLLAHILPSTDKAGVRDMAPLDSFVGGNSGRALSKQERVRRALACAEVDCAPCSFWSLVPGIGRDPAALVAQTLRFAAALDVDFKVMSNGILFDRLKTYRPRRLPRVTS